MNKKAQTWSFDLVIAVVLFVVVVGLFYSLIVINQEKSDEDLTMQNDILISKMDCGSDSSVDTCFIIDGEVDTDKLKVLFKESYNSIKKDLGVSGDFCIYLRDLNGNIYPIAISDNEKMYGFGDDELILTSDEIRCGDIVVEE